MGDDDEQHHQYLSPAAVSSLDSTLGASSSHDDNNKRGSLDFHGVPSLMVPSCSSSEAPSSPKGSADSSVSSSATAPRNKSAINTRPPPPQCCRLDDDDEVDPYTDVRDRMERLSLRDKTKHVFRGEAEDSDKLADLDEAPCSPHRDITIFAAITTYLGYVVLIVTGHFRDVCAKVFRKGRYFRSTQKLGRSPPPPPSTASSGNYPSDDFAKYAPLLKSWENFYTRRLYHRIQDCFNRPIASRPAAVISVLERVSFDGNKTMSVLGKLSNLDDEKRAASYRTGDHYDEASDGRVVRRCLNLGSYNYLGFADDWDVTCRKGVSGSLSNLPPSVGSSRSEFGSTSLHRSVERIVASFCGKEDAVVLNMGFNTNATIIPTLTSRGDLIVSDDLNHTSIVNGARASGAAIRTFRHNDASDLELTLREAIVYGQPRTRRPWNKILVVVEGIYSMEGEYCDLRNVVRVCKEYGAYVYLDEAHSIGAMG
eukprot:CAMPEP_0201636454 /NCGR_PEP_ID=MMETSP0493-20130528/8609_1 /ASSEMBLY_ACC=CAM_ASM_000838 /TAXON_ID=420259 /ORGANISM="Thalassiosira gravida, Strain GMp14c1" /LENGTH=481 /DNA_ID=CAMNT_0048108557 /DNA_START=19 /DNA_END=1460 /DNA_ORIENTATION=-